MKPPRSSPFGTPGPEGFDPGKPKDDVVAPRGSRALRLKRDHDRPPHELRKKGAFLRRHFAGEHNAGKPLRGRDGSATPHALLAHRVGEPVPTRKAHVRALAAKGAALLKGYRAKAKR